MKKREIIRSGIILIAELMKNELKATLLKKSQKGKRSYRKKRYWVRPWIARRKLFGASDTLCRELAAEDRESFKNMLRMDTEKFDELLRLVEPIIAKQNTFFREAIPASTRLQVTLRFLATGDSYKSLELLFRIPQPTLSYLIPAVLKAIITVLKEHMKVRTMVVESCKI